MLKYSLASACMALKTARSPSPTLRSRRMIRMSHFCSRAVIVCVHFLMIPACSLLHVEEVSFTRLLIAERTEKAHPSPRPCPFAPALDRALEMRSRMLLTSSIVTVDVRTEQR